MLMDINSNQTAFGNQTAFISKKIIYLNYEYCYKYEIINENVQKTRHDVLTCPQHEETDTKIIYHIGNTSLLYCLEIRLMWEASKCGRIFAEEMRKDLSLTVSFTKN